MGVVRFYACAGDPVLVALRLVHKALREPDPALWVTGDATALQALSRALWSGDGFVAHAPPGASERVRQCSRLILSTEPPEQPPGLLISLEALDTDAAGLTAQRHFDVFGGGQAQRDAARERFRWHQRQGVQPESVQV